MSESTSSRRDITPVPEISFQELFDNAPIGVFTTTPRGGIVSVNAALVRMFGFQSSEEMSGSITDIASQLYADPADRDEFKRLLEEQGEVLNHECLFQRRDGTRFWGSMNVRLKRNENGRVSAYQGFITDISDRKKTSEKLKQLEWMLSGKPLSDSDTQPGAQDQGYGDLTLLNHDGVILKSIGRERLENFANDYLELLGTSSAIYEANGDYAFGIFASGWCRMMDCASRKLCETRGDVEALNSGQWLCHESCWTNCSRRAIAERAPVDIPCSGGLRIHAIPIFAGEEVVGAINFGYGNPPGDPEQLRKLSEKYRLDYEDLVREARAYHSRPPFIIELAKKRLRATARIIGSMVETRRADKALRDSERKYRLLVENQTDLVVKVDTEGRFLFASPSYCRMFGKSEEELLGRKFLPLVHEEDRAATEEAMKKLYSPPHTAFIEQRAMTEKGWIWIAWADTAVLDCQGNVKEIIGVGRDITERKRMEEELRHSHLLMKYIIEHDRSAIAVHDKDLRYIYVSRKYIDDYNIKDQNIIGRHHYDVFPDLPQKWKEVHRKALAGQILSAEDDPYTREDGSVEWTRWECRPWHESDGSIGGIIVYTEVITERKRMAEDREKMQAQLVQAQKMESVGRLAGGVAHDYNNMLGVIIGNAELALDKLSDDDPLHGDLREILDAARRSADITSQLLAFARWQIIDPKEIDLNETVEHMLKMLRRLIGEDINLSWQPGRGAMPVFMDPSQLDQLLANLLVNARDAINGVGRVTIHTDSVLFDDDYCAVHAGFVPGEFIMLTVSDNGCGMDRETISSVFEPFFTTKGVGKGTGLGLSTVYGIVKQNSGFINVYSEPGEGATFKIYLPRHEGQGGSVSVKDPVETPMGHGETILVVEDEITILKLTRRMLEMLGYTVLAASNPCMAEALAAEHAGSIHLLLTDVVMPEINGRDLAERFKTRYPNLRVMFMSGYTANVIAHRGTLDPGFSFIQKPFSNLDLAVKVRETLDKELSDQ